MEMYADLQFDRPIDDDKHYISPGGYEFVFKEAGALHFDFYVFSGTIDKEDPTILHCEMWDEMDDEFPDCKKLCEAIQKHDPVVGVNEFFVYTGEDDDPELNLVRVIMCELVCGEERCSVPEKHLRTLC